MGGLLKTKSWVSVPKMEKIKKKESCFRAQNGKIKKKIGPKMGGLIKRK